LASESNIPLWGFCSGICVHLCSGTFAYPIARLALPGFRQYAYPLGRIVGLVLLAWLAWMGGSVGIPFTRVSISVAFVIVAVAGVGLWLMRKEQFKADWDSNRRFFVMVEILFLVFFLIDLLIRLWQLGPVASVEGRRAANGLFVFQCSVEEYELSAL
jgi:hypothetical protein